MAGMDPLAKQLMWDVISLMSTRRGRTAVILTTHRMNEAQALCTRMGIMVGGRLQCIGSLQHLKIRFGNHLEFEVKPTEGSSLHLETVSLIIQKKLCEVPSHPRSMLSDIEAYINGTDMTPDSASVAKISLSKDSIIMIARCLGDEEQVKALINSTAASNGILSDHLFEQVVRDGISHSFSIYLMLSIIGLLLIVWYHVILTYLNIIWVTYY